jgi:hypothetical protein
MDGMYIGKLIGVSFLLFKFIIIPFGSSLAIGIKLFTLKKTLKNSGNNFYKEPDRKTPIAIIYINIALIILVIFMALLGEWFVPILCFSYIIYSIGDLIINKIYGNVCGIYENGIIDHNMTLKKWNKIHSYKIIDNTVSGYFNNGKLFEYKNIENINEINNVFEKNNIQKRDN